MKIQDRFPGKPKILFIGLPYSSHTHCWIDLLQDTDNLNVRLFSSAPGYPRKDWWVPTYVLSPNRLGEKDPDNKDQYLTHQMEQRVGRFKRPGLAFFWLVVRAFRKVANGFGRFAGAPPLGLETFSADPDEAFQAWQISIARQLPYNEPLQSRYARYWLAEVIRDWQPDLIHTLGIFDDQGGQFYLQTRQEYDLAGIGKWVCQVRGGPDLALYRHTAEKRAQIEQILHACTSLIADNALNYQYAQAMGLPESKASSLGPIPGTGGIDIDALVNNHPTPPSARERLILWPKAYECLQSKALPVLEAISSAWESIQPCTVVMTAVTPEVEMWVRTLPENIQANFSLHQRVAREQMLEWMGKARVILMPSLSDGIPNTLYEAMAAGAFPVLSPLATITPIVKEEENVLFARNLYPNEIANALIRAINDDLLVDTAAVNNRSLVRLYADRSRIRDKVRDYYLDLCNYPI